MPHKIGTSVVANWIVLDMSHTLVINIWLEWMRFLLMFLLAHYPFVTFKCSNTSSHSKFVVSNPFFIWIVRFQLLKGLRYGILHNFFHKLWIKISRLIFNVNCPPHSAKNKLGNLFNFLPWSIFGCQVYMVLRCKDYTFCCCNFFLQGTKLPSYARLSWTTFHYSYYFNKVKIHLTRCFKLI
jgi:hypothetical protein